ncbi:MAG: hypothetical protein HC930_08735 [Hydrococcus sp. SU_1_0]|nr:hypothetical protein [Hydrococcus sp. SU_1_0]
MVDPKCSDLATKEELQELRDQLNALLGEKEDGSKVDLFVKNNSALATAGLGAVTLLGMAKNVAPKAVVDIITEGTPVGTTWQKLASMNTGIKAKFGNGAIKAMSGVDIVANTAGQAAATSTTAAKVAGNAASSLAVLASLVQIAGTLALNKATVDILSDRIDAEASAASKALDQQNSSMLRLYDKHQGQIESINVEIENNNAIAANTQQQLLLLRSDVTGANESISELNGRLDEAQASITELRTQNAEATAQIARLEIANAELTDTINKVETQLTEALNIIETQKADIQKASERTAAVEARMESFEAQLEEFNQNINQLKTEFQILREDLNNLIQGDETDDQIIQIRSRIASAKLIIEQQRLEKNPRSSAGVALQESATAQVQNIRLAQKLAEPSAPPITVTSTDVLNNPRGWGERFNEFLDNISPGGDMSPEQESRLEATILAGVTTTILPRLNNLSDAVSQSNISSAVQNGICSSLNGGSCPATPGVSNPIQGLKGMNADLGNAILNGADLVQGGAMAKAVDRIDKTVHHNTWGLEKMQDFADTAWQATRADKVLQAVNTTLLIHNGMMLSNNLLQTMGEATSMALQAMGINDHANQPIDVNTLVKGKIDAVLSNVLGAENYKALTARIAKANRIYQSGINILDATRNMFDATHSIAEVTVRHTGEIGNALRDAGVVYENAYEEMVERVNPASKRLMGLQKFRDGIEVTEEAFDSVAQVSGSVLEIQQNVTEIKTEKTALVKEMDDDKKAKVDKRVETKTESEVTTIPEKADFEKAVPES